MKLAPFGRRNRAVANELSGLSPLEAALHPALEAGRWHVPDRFNFTRDVIEVLAEDPKRRALMRLGAEGVIEPRTFHQLAEGASRWASQLRERGVGPGDCVLVLVASKLAWIEVMLAGIKVGAVTVPCPHKLSAAALDIRIASTGAKLVVADRASGLEPVESEGRPAVLYVEDIDSLPPQREVEEPSADTSARDLAFVLSTSGTAFGPHGVAHTHAAAYAARAQAEHWLDAGAHDVVWCTSDTGSAHAVWNVLLGPWSQGAEIVIHDGVFNADERLDLIRRLDVTILCQTPAEYRALAEKGQAVLERYRAPLLRRLVSTGDVSSPDVAVAFMDAWGLAIHDGYSAAECGIIAGWGAGTEPRAGCVGIALPGQDVVVIDAGGHELPPGTEGDLAVRGRPPTMFHGYWQAPDETKATFRGDLYVTGDIATIDQDGRIRVVGRAQDVISSGGLRFSPTDVEDALRTHEVVADAGVVGSRDLERGGQYVRAFVVLRPGAQGTDRLVAEIRQHLRKSLPESMVPREVDFVDALPRTQDGKLRRLELRERPIVRAQPAWTGAGAEPKPWKPQPEIAPEPEPVVIEEVEEEDELLPDYVVPRAQTLAASLEPEPVAEDGAGSERGSDVERGGELPDYIVQGEPEDDPLPDYVVSFLRSEPLTDIEHPVPIESPRTSLPRLAPDGKFETKPEPQLDPRPLPTTPEQDLEKIMFAPAGEAAPVSPSDPPGGPPEPDKPKFTVIPRPIEQPRPYTKRPTEPKAQPKPPPEPEPEPEPPTPRVAAPSPGPPPDTSASTSRPTDRPPSATRPPAASPAPPEDPAPIPAKRKVVKPKPPEAATPPEAARRPETPNPPEKAEVTEKPAAAARPRPPETAKPPEAARPPEKAKPTQKPPAAAKPAPKPKPRPAQKPAAPPASTTGSKLVSKSASTPVPKPARKPAAKPAPKAKPAVAAASPPAPAAPPISVPPPAPEPELVTALDPTRTVDKDSAKRGRRGRRKKDAAKAAETKQRSRFSRSAPEPGMENQDVTFMEGLSSRLSAYSVSADEDVAIPVAKPRPDGDSGENG